MDKRIVGVYNNGHEAVEAIEELKRQGYNRDAISVVAKDRDDVEMIHEETDTKAEEGMAAGAATGGVLGGLAGLLAGVGALAIPGIGPILAAGPIAATLTGAAVGAGAGGLAGALIGMGIPEDEANRYESDVKSGKILVLVDEQGKRNVSDNITASTAGGLGADSTRTFSDTDDSLRGTTLDNQVNNGSGTGRDALRTGTVNANADTLGGNRTVGGMGVDSQSTLGDNISVGGTSSNNSVSSTNIRNEGNGDNLSGMMAGGSSVGGAGVTDPAPVNPPAPDADTVLGNIPPVEGTGRGLAGGNHPDTDMGNADFNNNEAGYNPGLGTDPSLSNTPPANSEYGDSAITNEPFDDGDGKTNNNNRNKW